MRAVYNVIKQQAFRGTDMDGRMLVNAHAQMEEKQYEAGLISEGFAPEQIRKYGFAFQGKSCLIG